uniref:RRM domain-containing protein n=2 Tax=Ditylum brightwellii TaxID=49249 RepID=A0A7S1Z6Z7_9STRA|mmetsp:Transcript_25820/g.38378  ORF Transcript_25820/g.38378 Transcript_25820/m.38378 type:complete len:379 (+) Transcript_25820:741-1877(+)
MNDKNDNVDDTLPKDDDTKDKDNNSVTKENRGGRSKSRSPSRSRSRSRGGGGSSTTNDRKRRKTSREDDNDRRSRRNERDRDIKEDRRGRSSASEDDDDDMVDDDKNDTPKKDNNDDSSTLTKDRRTVFVSQLVMRADERDIRRYFRRKAGCKVNDVILLRDRRTGRHKGCAYVELGRLMDVPRAVEQSGKTPDFQRFPILVKASEAEKNYVGDTMQKVDGSSVTAAAADAAASAAASAAAIAASFAGTAGTTASGTSPTSATTAATTPLAPGEKRIEAQKVYVGRIDRCVTESQLFTLFSQFGSLDKVMLQMDAQTGTSRGFAFLSFKDPKAANLALRTMSGQQLAGRALKREGEKKKREYTYSARACKNQPVVPLY